MYNSFQYLWESTIQKVVLKMLVKCYFINYFSVVMRDERYFEEAEMKGI